MLFLSCHYGVLIDEGVQINLNNYSIRKQHKKSEEV